MDLMTERRGPPGAAPAVPPAAPPSAQPAAQPSARPSAQPAAMASPLGLRRRLLGWLVAVAGPVLVSLAVQGGPGARTTGALAYLAVTVLGALLGGLWP